MDKPPEIIWVIDSAGIEIACVNGKGLTLKQAYRGHLLWIGKEYFAVIGDPDRPLEGKRLGPFETQARARTELVKHIWEGCHD